MQTRVRTRAFARAWALGSGLGLSIALACSGSGTDSTELSLPAASGASDGLDIATNTSALLAGTFTRGEQLLEFEIRHGAGGSVIAIYGGGALLLGLTLEPERERMELGNSLSLEGPRGSLFRAGEPRWSELRVTGDARQLPAALEDPLFRALGDLSRAMSHRTDIDPGQFPELRIFTAAPASLADESASSLGVARQELRLPKLPKLPDPRCLLCQAACAGATAACLAELGSEWWALITCAPANVLCYSDCSGGACG